MRVDRLTWFLGSIIEYVALIRFVDLANCEFVEFLKNFVKPFPLIVMSERQTIVNL